MTKKETGPLLIWLLRVELTGEIINAWLQSYDPDANEGRGEYTWTEDRDKALRFADLNEAHACWAQQSSVKPLRSDGKPNRPLTAISIEVRPLERGTGKRWGRNIQKGHS